MEETTTYENLISTLSSSSLPLPEKQKFLYNFVKENRLTSSTVTNFLNAFPLSVKNTEFYQQIKYRLAHAFQRADLVLDLLRQNVDPSIVDKAVKLKWLYRDPNFVPDGHALVDILFPTVSHRCRGKIVTGIGKWMNTRPDYLIDSMFDCIRKRYGLQEALPMLTVCSREKIEALIFSTIHQKVNIQLTDRQWLTLATKFPDLVYAYLTQFHKKCPSLGTKCYLRLFDCDATKFINFVSSHSAHFYSMVLGRGRVRKIVGKNQSDSGRILLLEHFEIFNEKFQFSECGRREILKSVKKDDDQLTELVSKVLPREIEGLEKSSQFFKWLPLNRCSAEFLFEILNKAIFKKYGCRLDFDEETFFEVPTKNVCLQYLPPEVLLLFPVDQRLRAVKWKIENEKRMKSFSQFYLPITYASLSSFLSWTVLKPMTESVGEINEIFKTNVEFFKRTDNLEWLLTTCWVNQDADELLEILRRAGQRLRNDHADVRSRVIDSTGTVMTRDPPIRLGPSKQHWTLGRDHWTVVMEMVQLSIFNKEYSYAVQSKRKIVDRYIAFLFEEKTKKNSDLQNDLDQVVQLFIKLRTNSSYCEDWVIPRDLKKITDQLEWINLLLNELEKQFPLSSTITPLPPDAAGIVKSILECQKGQLRSKLKLTQNSWLFHRVKEFLDHLWLNSEGSLFPPAEFEGTKTVHKGRILRRWEILKNFISTESISHFEKDEDEDAILEKMLTKNPSEILLTHFLIMDPSKLTTNWKEIVQNFLQKPINSQSKMVNASFFRFVQKLKMEGYNNLLQVAVEECLKIFENESHILSTNVQKDALILLSILDAPKFLKMAVTLYPIESQQNVFVSQSQIDLEMKTVVCKCLGRLTLTGGVEALDVFEVIQKFCVGDFLKLATGALHRHSHRTVQKLTLHVLRQGWKDSGKNVSIKKHYLRLFFDIASIQDCLEMAQILWTSGDQDGNDHVTIRHQLFGQIMHLFLTADHDTDGRQEGPFWTLLSTAIVDLKPTNRMSLQSLHESTIFSKIPPKFLSKYVKLCLTHLEAIKSEEIGWQFLSQVRYVVDSLDEETLTWLVQLDLGHLLGDNVGHQRSTCFSRDSTFYANYIMGAITAREDSGANWNRLTILKDALSRLIQIHWLNDDDEDDQKFKEAHLTFRRALASFILALCKNALEKIVRVVGETRGGNVSKIEEILTEFCQLLESLVPFKCFKLIFFIQLTLSFIKANVEEDKFTEFGILAAKLVDSTVERVAGPQIAGLIGGMMRSFLHNTLPSAMSTYDISLLITHGLLIGSQSLNCHAVATALCPRSKPVAYTADDCRLEIWEKVQKKFKNLKQPAAQILTWYED